MNLELATLAFWRWTKGLWSVSMIKWQGWNFCKFPTIASHSFSMTEYFCSLPSCFWLAYATWYFLSKERSHLCFGFWSWSVLDSIQLFVPWFHRQYSLSTPVEFVQSHTLMVKHSDVHLLVFRLSKTLLTSRTWSSKDCVWLRIPYKNKQYVLDLVVPDVSIW